MLILILKVFNCLFDQISSQYILKVVKLFISDRLTTTMLISKIIQFSKTLKKINYLSLILRIKIVTLED